MDEISFTIVNQFGGEPRALAVEGATVYAGFGQRLFILDAGDPANPRLLGQSAPLAGIIRALDVAGNAAFLATGEGGLVVLDVSNPANITILNGGPNYAGEAQPSAEDVTVIDNTVYLVDRNRSAGSVNLLRFDITNPAQPSLLETIELGNADEVVIENGLIVVVGDGRFQLRDVANPSAVLSETPLAQGANPIGVAVHDNVLFAGMERFDVSDPANPAALGDLPSPASEVMFVHQAAANSRSLFWVDTYGEFGFCGSTIHVFDLRGGAPQAGTGFAPDNCVGEIAVQENRLYVIGSRGLQIFDVSDPANPAQQGRFTHPDGFSNAAGVAQRDGVTYVLTADGSGFEIATLDLSRSTAAVLAERLTLGDHVLLDPLVAGNTLVAPVWNNGISTVDITNPAAPQILRETPAGEGVFNSQLFSVVANDNVVYLPAADSSQNGIGVIDLSDPAEPVLVSVLGIGNAYGGNLALDDNRLAILGNGHLMIYDASRPLEPQPAGVLELPEAAGLVAFAGNTLYAACSQGNCGSLFAIDVTDPGSPTVTHQWALPFEVYYLLADGRGVVYAVTLDDGIWALDAADPDNLRLAGHLQLPGSPAMLEVAADGALYAAAGSAGLYVIQAGR